MIRVIKLGGSLVETAAVSECLDYIERTTAGQTVIVPGGGMFAEQVRRVQHSYPFNDSVAHRMAILAMQQMAWLFKGLKPGFGLLESLDTLNAAEAVVIWLPQITELEQAGIPASWDVTSDSLAAWLAGRLAADELILVKSAPIDVNATVLELQRQGIVDQAFCNFADVLTCPLTVINKQDFLCL